MTNISKNRTEKRLSSTRRLVRTGCLIHFLAAARSPTWQRLVASVHLTRPIYLLEVRHTVSIAELGLIGSNVIVLRPDVAKLSREAFYPANAVNIRDLITLLPSKVRLAGWRQIKKKQQCSYLETIFLEISFEFVNSKSFSQIWIHFRHIQIGSISRVNAGGSGDCFFR